jgi:hypothetical protein
LAYRSRVLADPHARRDHTAPEAALRLFGLRWARQNRTIFRHAGGLRVSARHLDKAQSTDTIPAHTCARVEKLAPGEIADVAIDMLPVGLVFYPGQQLRLVISAHNPWDR